MMIAFSWLVLNPRELEQLSKPIRGNAPEAVLLRDIVSRIRRDGLDAEIAVAPEELAAAREYARHWRSPHATMWAALASAAHRHTD